MLLAGCAYDEDAFRYEADRATCQWAEECALGEGLTFDECMEESEAAWTDPDPSCVFDPTSARSCVAGLRQLECPEGEEIPGFPTACERVWTQCESA